MHQNFAMSRLVEIAAFYDPEEAYCVQAAVRSGGCFSILYNEHHLGVAPTLRIGLRGFRLLVLEQDAEDVRNALIAYVEGASAQTHSTTPVETDLTRRINWLWVPVALFTQTPFVPTFVSPFQFAAQAIVSLPFFFMIWARFAY